MGTPSHPSRRAMVFSGLATDAMMQTWSEDTPSSTARNRH